MDLSCSLGGSAYPSGKYTYGTTIGIHAAPASGYYFDRWVGLLAGKGQTIFLCVKKNIVSTAYFKSNTVSNPRPCVDSKTGKANPLKDMTLAKTGGWNIAGATFGMTRRNKNNKPKMHWGIDFYGEIGTEVYSMYDGIIGEVVSEQPNRIGKNLYPEGYKGDKNGAGNSITIKSDGLEPLGYWHLQAGNAIAINPRTGKPFKEGDQVYQGEVIGYLGRSGNAWDVPYPHVHLSAGTFNNYVDPAPYINGTISTSSIKISNIICDE